jgi:hypothetical protein
MSKTIFGTLLALALFTSGMAQAQQNNGLNGTWLATKTGMDAENMTERQLGETVYWVIKQLPNGISVRIFVETASGVVIPAYNKVTGASYDAGTLYVSSEPPPTPNDAFMKMTTYYQIPMYTKNGSVLGSYIVQSLFVAGAALGPIVGAPITPQPSVAASGTISLIKQSNSTGEPKPRPRPKQLPGMPPQPAAPTFNPYAPTPGYF